MARKKSKKSVLFPVRQLSDPCFDLCPDGQKHEQIREKKSAICGESDLFQMIKDFKLKAVGKHGLSV